MLKTSGYLRIMRQNGSALCFHSLFGNLFLLGPEYLPILDSFIDGKGDFSKPDVVADLKRANFLIDEAEDERKLLGIKNIKWLDSVRSGGQLKILTLLVSEACNFGCGHCLHSCSVKTSTTHGKKKFMDLETAKRAIDLYRSVLASQGREHLRVGFGSAEPLLNWQVLRESVRYIRSLDKDAEVSVNTNLSLLTFEMACFFRDNRVYISTSLDGPPEGNDAIRVFPNGRGTFSRIVEKFKMLEAVGYPLDGFSITINDLNFSAITPDFIRWAHGQGFKGIATDVDLINAQNSSTLVEAYVDKLVEIRRTCLELGIENFGSWTTAYHNLVNEPEDGMPTFCKAIKGQSIAVNPEGMIFICGHTTTPIGDLDHFEEVFKNKSELIRLVEARLPGNDPICVGCEIEGVCAGQCQITREVAKTTGNKKDIFLCSFYKLATKKLLEEKMTTELTNNG